MMQAVKERVTIQPGGRIELDVPGLPAGAVAEVIVMVEQVESDAQVAIETSADAGPQTADYRELLQVPDADEADRWSWEWVGPGQDLRAKVVPQESDGEP